MMQVSQLRCKHTVSPGCHVFGMSADAATSAPKFADQIYGSVFMREPYDEVPCLPYHCRLELAIKCIHWLTDSGIMKSLSSVRVTGNMIPEWRQSLEQLALAPGSEAAENGGTLELYLRNMGPDGIMYDELPETLDPHSLKSHKAWVLILSHSELQRLDRRPPEGLCYRVALPVACGGLLTMFAIVGYSGYQCDRSQMEVPGVEKLAWYNQLVRTARVSPDICYDCWSISKALDTVAQHYGAA